ncbi:MAG: hypothetical protein DMD91_31150, partial [Candidatus Rokuibacteriota bacterium]
MARDGRALARRAAALDRARGPARHSLRHSQGRGDRPHEPPRLALPPVNAELLARPDADLALRGSLRHLILPAVTLAAAPLAQNVRLVRAGMLEVMQQDFVRTARAKGLGERAVIYRHALRNAAIPVLTVTGLSLGFMLSGAIVIETVFSWPGMGR